LGCNLRRKNIIANKKKERVVTNIGIMPRMSVIERVKIYEKGKKTDGEVGVECET
jgi:hypothetical protein